jgi:hypothetical protein
VSDAGRRLTWDETARRMLPVYEAAVLAPAREARVGAADALAADARRAEFEALHRRLLEDIGPTGLSLVGPGGHLPQDAQRTIAGLARRRLTRRPFLGGLSVLRRLARADGR